MRRQHGGKLSLGSLCARQGSPLRDWGELESLVPEVLPCSSCPVAFACMQILLTVGWPRVVCFGLLLPQTGSSPQGCTSPVLSVRAG